MILAICGYKQAGKTTFASRFEAVGFLRRPLAAPLKDMLRVGFGLTPAQLYGDEKEVPCAALGGKTPRHAMETLGTEWGREHLGHSAWIGAWRNTSSMSRDLVVDDLRFPNEAIELLALGAYFIRVERDGTEPTGEVHESEAYAHRLPVDFVIPNTTTVDFLTEAAEGLLADLENVPGRGTPRIADFRALLEELR